jgi:aconitate decarboxylase
MIGLTVSLARFVASAADMAIPEEAARIVKTGFIDTIATMLAGRNEEVVRIIERLYPGGNESAVLLGQRQASARNAALINGTAGHALDFDDVALLGHPSTVLVPVALAEAERLGRSGVDALRAYLVGYEVWAELAGREADPVHDKGWHPTGVFGAVAAAAAAATLNRSSEIVARNALGLGASLGSGLVANFGTMAKPLHAGNAAAHGIDAVRMAMAGMTASADVLEHPAGFLAAVSPRGRVDRKRPSDRIGKDLQILESRLSIKKYPVCYATHRAIDGMIALADAHDLKAAEIDEVTVTFGRAQAAMLRNHRPRSALEAKFSIEFAVAAAIVARRVGLAQLTDDFVRSDLIQNMLGKVRTELTDTQSPGENGLSLTEHVEVVTADGRRLMGGEVRHALGHAKRPLDPADLWSKFSDCTAGVTWIDAPAVFERLGRLEQVHDLCDLWSKS